MKKLFGVSLDETILEQLDEERGLIPRSTYLEKILSDRYNGEGNGTTVA